MSHSTTVNYSIPPRWCPPKLLYTILYLRDGVPLNYFTLAYTSERVSHKTIIYYPLPAGGCLTKLLSTILYLREGVPLDYFILYDICPTKLLSTILNLQEGVPLNYFILSYTSERVSHNNMIDKVFNSVQRIVPDYLVPDSCWNTIVLNNK